MTPATPNCHCNSSYHDWSSFSLAELIDHVVGQHHAYLWRELPRLNELAGQCADAPRQPNAASMLDLRRTLSALSHELTLHMHKEELVLFPWIRQIEPAGGERVSQRRSLAAPIGLMQQEHRFASEGLARIRWLTHDYTSPGPCSDAYRLLLAGLAELEADLQQHIREENDVLFPRAMELESVALLHA